MRETKEVLKNVLNNIGIREKLKAHRYLKFIICDILEKENTTTFTSSLYERVAQMSNKTKSSVERDIRYGIEVGFSKCDGYLVKEIFGDNISEKSGKISNLKFIKLLWEWLIEQQG